MASPSPRRRWWTVAVVAAMAVVVGLAVFQPWLLWVTTSVDDAPPSSTTTPSRASTTTAPEPGGPSTGATTAPPTPPPSPTEPVVVSRGTFVSHEHATTGEVVVLELPDGSRVLRLEDLDTSSGPQLEVWLSDQPVVEGPDGWFVFDEGRHVSLGELKGNRGNQNYPIPDDVDLAEYPSVSIWCVRFGVSFGAAELSAPAP